MTRLLEMNGTRDLGISILRSTRGYSDVHLFILKILVPGFQAL